MSFPIKDLSTASPRSAHEANFMYSMDDINRITAQMGIPWEKSKGVPFGTTIRYIGLKWNITQHTVALPLDKRDKYRAAIIEWNTHPTHTLCDTQVLYGKLLHTCHIFPASHAYLTRLKIFMGNFHNTPFQPCTPPKGTGADLEWWFVRLALSSPSLPIPGPINLVNHYTFSDASSGMGLGIIVEQHWHAWRLTGD